MRASMRAVPERDVSLRPDGLWSGRSTRAEVNLDAVRANVMGLRRHVGESRLLAVVKANGYGPGATMVARAALDGGATWLGVYCVEEGVALREAGIEAPILIFGPFEAGEASDVVESRLTPTIHNLEAAEALSRVAANRTVPFHLKIDTGLTRAGVPPEDALALAKRLRDLPTLRPQGLYTHFASADEPCKESTWEQLRVFLETADAIERAGITFPLRHAANSAATLDCPPTWLHMVRCGISIYGCYPSDAVSRTVPLQPALALKTTVARVRQVPAGTGVGYGHEFRCCRDSIIALAPIGYGDGLPRTLGHGTGRVLVREALAPIVGRVSMDQITVDVTDIPAVTPGDEVTLIGTQAGVSQTAEDVAAQAGTISYDIVTGILPRVPRLYYQRGELVGVTRFARGLHVLPAPVLTGSRDREPPAADE